MMLYTLELQRKVSPISFIIKRDDYSDFLIFYNIYIYIYIYTYTLRDSSRID